MPVSSIIQNKINALPSSSGIYQMIGRKNTILYIGKAKNLKNRIKSYFYKKQDREITKQLIFHIEDVDIIITNTEKEALILENTLIKKYQPPYNILLKDDKTYPYIKIIEDLQYPKIIKTRIIKNDKNSYFGPYTNMKQFQDHFETLNDLFPFKKCKTKQFPKDFKPCLYFHIHRCLPYCSKTINSEIVKDMISKAKEILKGNNSNILKTLKKTMLEHSQKQEYEMALKFKKHIEKISNQIEYQTINLIDRNNFDVINYYINEKNITFVILHFENGKMNDKTSFHYKNKIVNKKVNELQINYFKSILSNFIMQFYQKNLRLISDIILPIELNDEKELIEILEKNIYSQLNSNMQKRINLSFIYPKIGKYKRLLQLAYMNAKLSFEELIKKQKEKESTLYLKKLLKLSSIPKVIESFDIANTADQFIMAGMVQFIDGEKNTDEYRLFNIKNTTTQNDFISMKEAVSRRYKSLIENKKKLPDLIMIDGGKGQLNSALEALNELGISHQPIISLAKREEEIFVPKKKEPIPIENDNLALKLLIKIRDETHRFVNSNHTRKRDKQNIQSILTKIPGIGVQKKKILLKNFKSFDEILYSNESSLSKLPLINKTDIQNILLFLKKYNF